MNDIQLADKIKRILADAGATAKLGTFITSHQVQDQLKAEGGFDIANGADHKQYYQLLPYLKDAGVINVVGEWPLKVQLA